MGDHARRRAPGDAGHGPSALERAQQRWGVERALLTYGAGLDEESDLARHFQRHLRHLPVVMLHDRRLPGDAVVAHLAVAPGGVTVIEESADLEPPLRVERLRGVFATRVELLRDAAKVDRTAVLAPLWERLAAVRRIVADAAPVEGALCLSGPAAGPPPVLRPLTVHGILVGDAKAVAAFAARHGDLSDVAFASLAEHLHAMCPPVLLG